MGDGTAETRRVLGVPLRCNECGTQQWEQRRGSKSARSNARSLAGRPAGMDGEWAGRAGHLRLGWAGLLGRVLAGAGAGAGAVAGAGCRQGMVLRCWLLLDGRYVPGPNAGGAAALSSPSQQAQRSEQPPLALSPIADKRRDGTLLVSGPVVVDASGRDPRPRRQDGQQRQHEYVPPSRARPGSTGFPDGREHGGAG